MVDDLMPNIVAKFEVNMKEVKFTGPHAFKYNIK